MSTVQPGHYRHYKGKDYTVLGVALHSETNEELVVYRPEYGERGLWVRPQRMFLETVAVDGQPVPRFQYIPDPADGGRPTAEVKVYYLEMFGHPTGEFVPPREGLAVLHARRPTVAYYRFLYDTVGRDYHWYSRGKLTDAELAAVLENPLNEVHVLHADGTPAGFVEFDRRAADEIEIVQFGLMPGFIGQGLGKFFLRWAIDHAWGWGPRRLWLHTCTLDHPAALPNYLEAGFKVYREETLRRVC